MVSRVTHIGTAQAGQAATPPPRPKNLDRFILVLENHRPAHRSSRLGKGGRAAQREEELQSALETEMRKRQKMADALGKAEEELDMLRQKTGNGNGAGLEEALRAKEEELNRIKNDYATKMKNSLALQRIRYEREIDNLRKEIRKATMGREEVAEEIHKRESELAERENQAKRMELEVSELKKRLEAEAANVKKAEAV